MSDNENLFPKAHLNWTIFDRDWKFLDGGAKQLKGGAENGTDVDFGEINSSIEIKEPGYVYIWLSNTSATEIDVYFDDFKVSHTKSPVVATNEYYSFGLTFNSYQRENATKNNYLYNGKELQDELDLGWMDYGARMYMPDMGRWISSDPMSDRRLTLSPYNYVQNNPLARIDPTGMLDDYAMDREIGEINLVKVTKDKTDKLVDKQSNQVIASKVEKGILKDGLNIKQNGLETSKVKAGIELVVKISAHVEAEVQGAIYANSKGNFLKVDPYKDARKVIDKGDGGMYMTTGISSKVMPCQVLSPDTNSSAYQLISTQS